MSSLLALRERSGKRPERVAADLGLSVRTLARLEKGKPLTKVQAIAFADYYKVPVDEIEAA